MRYVELPEPIIVDTEDKGQERFGIREFVNFLINTDERFNRDGAGIRSATKVEAAFAGDDGPAALEDSDHERLQQSAEKPSNGYPLSPARRCQRFVDAIADAKKQKPEPKTAT